MKRRQRPGRKLLVASVGVAAVSYVACSSDGSGSAPTDASTDNTNQYDVVANLVAPDTGTPDVNQFDVVANLVAPDVDVPDASSDAPSDASDGSPLDVVANLVAPDN